MKRRPSHLTNLKDINKHWYRCLDPNKPNVNAIWEQNICRPMFPHIPKTLKVRRWDRFYQYRYSVILKYRKERGDKSKINSQRVYSKFKVIENCLHDIEAVNGYYRDPQIIDESGGQKKENDDDDDAKDGFDKYFDAEIGSHGLPNGFEWRLKCPVSALRLEERGKDRHYCSVCKENVFTVRNIEELGMRVDQGQCVQFKPKPDVRIMGYSARVVFDENGRRRRGRVRG